MDGLSDKAAKDALVTALYTFRRRAGLERTLRDLGVERRDLRTLAEHAFHDPCLATNPIQPTIAEIEQTYEQALST
jgi:alcohol dehydrogenase class IV